MYKPAIHLMLTLAAATDCTALAESKNNTPKANVNI